MKRRAPLAAALAASLLLISGSHAQRGVATPDSSRPRAEELAQAVGQARLNTAQAVSDTLNGGRVRFTPAESLDAAAVAAARAMFLGSLETEMPGIETGLPPGRYNLFLFRSRDGARLFAVANGVIVREAIRVEPTPQNGPRPHRRGGMQLVRKEGGGQSILPPNSYYVPPPPPGRIIGLPIPPMPNNGTGGACHDCWDFFAW